MTHSAAFNAYHNAPLIDERVALAGAAQRKAAMRLAGRREET
jgi:hypothetical protein